MKKAVTKYSDDYFIDGIDEATDYFQDCYDITKMLLDEAEEHNPEAAELVRMEIAYYLANLLYLFHRDLLEKVQE